MLCKHPHIVNSKHAKVIRRQLKAQGKSQNQLARDAEISVSHMSQILAGLRCPSLKVAGRLEDLTGIPAREFAAED